MNQERAILKGRLSDLKMQKMEIETSISANVKACKALLAGFEYDSIRKFDLTAASVHLREAAAQKTKLMEVIGTIQKIEEELA